MKIRVSKLFDIADIQDEELQETLAPLVSHMNASFDNIISALRKEITLEDNIKGPLRTVAMRHDTETTQIITGKLIGAIPLIVTESYTIRQPSANQVALTVQFTSTETTLRDVRWKFYTE